MSAFIVERAHIDLLVTALVKNNVVREVDADKVGAALWLENHRSVNARYREKRRAPKYAHSEYEVNPIEVLKQVACYEYQASEHEGWHVSAAHAWLLALRGRIIADNLIDERIAAIKASAAYDAAPWGVS